MRTPTRRIAAVVASAAIMVTLSGCTQGHWVYDAPPAAGVQADEGGLKLRNILIVSNTEGRAILLGGIASRDTATEVSGITVAPEGSDGGFGEATQVSFSESIPKGRTVYLDGSSTAFDDPALQLGRLAQVTVTFSTGQSVTVKAPVMSSEHPDFSEAWTAIEG